MFVGGEHPTQAQSLGGDRRAYPQHPPADHDRDHQQGGQQRRVGEHDGAQADRQQTDRDESELRDVNGLLDRICCVRG
jgi:hypothetical protein